MSNGGSLVGVAMGSTAGLSTATPFTIAWSALSPINVLKARDIALIAWTFNSGLAEDTPVGFTRLRNDAGSGTARSTLYQRVIDETESGSLTFDANQAQRHAAGMIVLRGFKPLTNTGDITLFDQTNTAATTHDAPAVTPPDDGCLICSFISERASAPNQDASFTAPTSPSMTKRFDIVSAGSGGVGVAWADEGFTTYRPGGVAVDPNTWAGVGGVGGTANVLVYTLALQPLFDRGQMMRAY